MYSLKKRSSAFDKCVIPLGLQRGVHVPFGLTKQGLTHGFPAGDGRVQTCPWDERPSKRAFLKLLFFL